MAHRTIIDVHVLLVHEDTLLLTRRHGDYGDGMWHLPSGKLDADESVLDAAVREAEEEVGVLLDPGDLRCVHTLHVHDSGAEPRLGIFFEATRWIGEPTNREPDKCSDLDWFALDQLPAEIISYPAAGIRAYRNNVVFSTLGWTTRLPASSMA